MIFPWEHSGKDQYLRCIPRSASFSVTHAACSQKHYTSPSYELQKEHEARIAAGQGRSTHYIHTQAIDRRDSALTLSKIPFTFLGVSKIQHDHISDLHSHLLIIFSPSFVHTTNNVTDQHHSCSPHSQYFPCHANGCTSGACRARYTCATMGMGPIGSDKREKCVAQSALSDT